MVSIQIRQAIADDIQQLFELEQKVIEAERPFNGSIKTSNVRYYNIPALISESDSYLIVAEFDGKIIATGYSQIRESKQSLKHDRHAYLGFMFVDTDYRGQGINRRILEELILWGKSHGIGDHYLDVYAKNSSAISAYQKIGFESSVIEMKLSS